MSSWTHDLGRVVVLGRSLIEHVDTPEGVVAEVGGMTSMRKGGGLASITVRVCSGRQRVHTFATGLHDPLGMLVRKMACRGHAAAGTHRVG